MSEAGSEVPPQQTPPKVGQLLRLECTTIAHRGLGVARWGGLVVFLFGALPGEEVSARVTKAHRRHVFADVEEVHQTSPDRVRPPCPYFGSCGGCQLQHASYRLQLELKEQVLREALERAQVALPTTISVQPSEEQWGYRWRGEFHTFPGQLGLGFKRRNSYQVLKVDQCPIHHPAIGGSLPALAQAAGPGDSEFRSLHLTVGEAGRELLVQSRPDPAAGEELAVRLGEAESFRAVTESTSASYRGRAFRVHSDSFIQVNQGSLGSLYEYVVELLGGDRLAGALVVDAYGGSGVLSLRLADHGARVTIIESSRVSARLGQLHAQMYGRGQVEVRRGEVEEQLPLCGTPDAVVLDPPRAGLAPQVCGWLSLAGPKVAVYLSCEVSALARDLHALCDLGPYRLEALRLVDMFPQTYHFETVALLRRS